MTHEDPWNMDGPRQYNVSGLDTRDQQEAEAAAEAVADDTFSISKGAFVRHIADAYKAGRAAGQGRNLNSTMTNLPELLNRAASCYGTASMVIDEGTFWLLPAAWARLGKGSGLAWKWVT